jgi:hypothetical protein
MAMCTREVSRLSWEVPLLLTKKVESRRTRLESCGSRAFEICHLNARRRVSGSTPTGTVVGNIIRNQEGRIDSSVSTNSLMTLPVALPSRTWTFARRGFGMVAAKGKVGEGVPTAKRMTYGCEELVQLNSARSVLLHGLLEDLLIQYRVQCDASCGFR